MGDDHNFKRKLDSITNLTIAQKMNIKLKKANGIERFYGNK
jgi:hypothetical protein